MYEINLGTLAQTLIANGGSRGDFVQVDPNNGTLLPTQTDSIYRLTAPEPSSIATTLIAVPFLLAYRRRLRKQAA